MESIGVAEKVVDGVCIQRVDVSQLDGCDLVDYGWCNTNNHRDTAGFRRLESSGPTNWYALRMQETRMDKWATVLGQCTGGRLSGDSHLVFTLTAKQVCLYFKPLAHLAYQEVRATGLYGEEAEALEEELIQGNENLWVPPSTGWFVRTNACSPKDALSDGGAGPHFSLKAVLLALFASSRVHGTLGDYSSDVTVYLMPFDSSITVERELRVFVHQGKVTAMSQYDVYNTSTFSGMRDRELVEVAKAVAEFHQSSVHLTWSDSGGIDSYIMDVEVVDVNGVMNVSLIELNSFGAEMASASALFHWVRDYKDLYTTATICIRIRNPE